jgi:hypothetical protein
MVHGFSRLLYTRMHDMIAQGAPTYWKELKEVLTTHGHRYSRVRDPECPSFHEADTQSFF